MLDLLVIPSPGLEPASPWLDPLAEVCRIVHDPRLVEVSPLIVLGEGDAGGLAQKLALRYPAVVSALVLISPDWIAGAAEIRVPALVIGGRDDPHADRTQRVFDDLPNAEMLVFERSGSDPYRTQNPSFCRAVADWLVERGAGAIHFSA